jgi:SWI/SNF-related matrix-associated actin-dependent regulator of chromatin subfamily A member 5
LPSRRSARLQHVPQAWVPRDHQFFPAELLALLEKEHLFECKTVEYKLPETAAKYKQRQKAIDDAEPLTEQEEADKKAYLEKGFATWSRKDFNGFIHGLEQYDADDLPAIAACVPDKTFEEVVEYSAVFWRRVVELKHFRYKMEHIKTNQATRHHNVQLGQYLARKVKMYEHPGDQLRLQYPPNEEASTYTAEDDRFLVCNLYELGWGTENLYGRLWRRVQDSEVTSKVLKGQPANDLHERCGHLLLLIETELKDGGGELSLKRERSSENVDGEDVAVKKQRVM